MNNFLKIIIAFILLVFLSCREEVVPSEEALQTIVSSESFTIIAEGVAGNIMGSYSFKNIIEVKNRNISLDYSNSNGQSSSNSKLVSSNQLDSLKIALYNILMTHDEEKEIAEFGSCTSGDMNYVILNSNTSIYIKPTNGSYADTLFWDIVY